jgi:hypothetical protein
MRFASWTAADAGRGGLAISHPAPRVEAPGGHLGQDTPVGGLRRFPRPQEINGRIKEINGRIAEAHRGKASNIKPAEEVTRHHQDKDVRREKDDDFYEGEPLAPSLGRTRLVHVFLPWAPAKPRSEEQARDHDNDRVPE